MPHVAVGEDLEGDGVGVPDTETPAHDTAITLKLAKGYPPVLGAMLVIDGIVALVTGSRASVSLGEAVVYLLLPPVAMLIVGAGRRSRVALIAAAAAAAVLFAALFLGGGVHLLAVPAWVELTVGALLLGLTAVLFAPRRQHVGRRRARP
jgi:hypothetical protein